MKAETCHSKAHSIQEYYGKIVQKKISLEMERFKGELKSIFLTYVNEVNNL